MRLLAIGLAASGLAACQNTLPLDLGSTDASTMPADAGGAAARDATPDVPSFGWGDAPFGDADPGPAPGPEAGPVCSHGASDWVLVRPDSRGLAYNYAYGVGGSSASDVWFVGLDKVHWDGGSFTTVVADDGGTDISVAPNPRVSAAAPDDAWVLATGLLHWDGTAWSPVNTAAIFQQTQNVNVTAVWARAKNDVWLASDSNEFAHYDGNAWTLHPGPQVQVQVTTNVMWGASSTDVWAAGKDLLEQIDIFHWDGTAWTLTFVMLPGTPRAISGTGTNDVWIAGSGSRKFRSDSQGLILHWDGSTWTDLTPAIAGYLEGVWAASPTDVWVTGQTHDDWCPSILHFDGATWSRVQDPIPTTFGDLALRNVWGSGPHDVWIGSNQGLLRWTK